jgi:uncharacterized protein YpmB
MKKMVLLLTVLALITFVSGVMAIRKPAPEPAPEAPASTAPGKPVMEKMKKFSGVIEKVDGRGKTLVVKGNMTKEEKTLTFIVNDRTKITQGKTSMTIGDLKKDMQVSIEYGKEMNKLIAVTIEVSVPKDAPKKI